MDKTKLRNDIILIGTLLIMAVVSLIIILTTRNKSNLIATVRVRNEIVLKIDLNKDGGKDFVVKGTNGDVHIHVKDGSIAVVESNCPHQDCVRTGYVSQTGKPIICAYNGVSITIEGNSNNDIVV